MTRLHLVDGTFELFRAHFSPRPGQRDSMGRDVKATLGLASSLLQLLDDPAEAVSHIAVAFDNPVESFRNDLFDGYKTGEGIDPALWAQFPLVERATHALGITVWSMIEFEADDALATAAARWGDDEPGHGQKLASRPSDRLKSAPPPVGSRYQNWKFQVEPAVIWPLGCGGLVMSTAYCAMPAPSAWVMSRR